MNTKDLSYFQALCEIKNFSKVAEKFDVSQPTITQALKRLEGEFEIQLIDRDQSHVAIVVTPAGQQLLAHVQIINQQLQVAKAELARARNPKVRLGLPPIIGAFYFPQLAEKLAKAHLIDQLLPEEAGSANLLESLHAGHLDAALLGSTGPLEAPDLNIQPLLDVPFAAVMAKTNPLAQARQLNFAELAQSPFITFSEGFVHTKAMTWFTQEAGVQPSIVFRTPDVHLLKQMVKSGVGVTLLARIAVVPSDDLVCLPLSDANQPRFNISLVTRKQLVPQPPLKAMLKVLASEVTKE